MAAKKLNRTLDVVDRRDVTQRQFLRQEILGKIYAPDYRGGCIGHNLTQEAPRAFAQAVIEVDGY